MPPSLQPYSLPYKVREICPTLEIRQFEFSPAYRYANIIACGTTNGHVCILDVEQNTLIGAARDTGKYEGDSVLGIAWLRSKPGFFISGTTKGTIRLFNGQRLLEDYYPTNGNTTTTALSSPSLGYSVPNHLSLNEYASYLAFEQQYHGRYKDILYPEIPDIPVVQSYSFASTNRMFGGMMLEHDNNDLTCVHVSCDDRYGLRSGHCRDVTIFDIENGKRIYTIPEAHSKYINISRFANLSPHLVATSSYDAEVALWDIRTPSHTQKALYRVTSSRGNITISFDPYDQYLLTCAIDNEIRCYNLSNGKQYSKMDIRETGRMDNYTRAYFTDDGHHILSGASEESVFRINSVATGELLSTSTLYDNKVSSSLYIQSLRGSPTQNNFYAMLTTYRDSSYPMRLITVDGNAVRWMDTDKEEKVTNTSSIMVHSNTINPSVSDSVRSSSTGDGSTITKPVESSLNRFMYWGQSQNIHEKLHSKYVDILHATPSSEWYAQIWNLCMQAQTDGAACTADTYSTVVPNPPSSSSFFFLPSSTGKRVSIGASGADITLVSNAVLQPPSETSVSTVRARVTLHSPIVTVRLPLVASLFEILRQRNPGYFSSPQLFCFPSSLMITPGMLQVITTYAYSDILVWPTFPSFRTMDSSTENNTRYDNTNHLDILVPYLGMTTDAVEEARQVALTYIERTTVNFENSTPLRSSEIETILQSSVHFRPSQGRWKDTESSLLIHGVNFPMIGPLVPLSSGNYNVPVTGQSAYNTTVITEASKDPRLLLQLWNPFHFFDYQDTDSHILKAHESTTRLERNFKTESDETTDISSSSSTNSNLSSSSSFTRERGTPVSSTVGWKGSTSSLSMSSLPTESLNSLSPHLDDSVRIQRILEGLCCVFQSAAVFGVPRLAHIAVAELFTNNVSSAVLQPNTLIPLVRIALAFGAVWPTTGPTPERTWPFGSAWQDYQGTTSKSLLTLMQDMWKIFDPETCCSIIPAATELLLCTIHYGFMNYPLLHSLGIWDEFNNIAKAWSVNGTKPASIKSTIEGSRRRHLSPNTSPQSKEWSNNDKRSRKDENENPTPSTISTPSASLFSSSSNTSTTTSSPSIRTVKVQYTFIPITLPEVYEFIVAYYTKEIRKPLPLNLFCERFPNSYEATIPYRPVDYHYGFEFTRDMMIEFRLTENAIHDTVDHDQHQRVEYLRKYKRQPNSNVYFTRTDPKTKPHLKIRPFRAYAKEADPLWRSKLHAPMYIPRMYYHQAVMITVPNLYTNHHLGIHGNIRNYSMHMMVFGGMNRHQINPSQIPLGLTSGTFRYNHSTKHIELDPSSRNTEYHPVWYKAQARGVIPQKLAHTTNAPLTSGISRFIVFYGHSNNHMGNIDNVTPGSMVWLDPAVWKSTPSSTDVSPRITSSILSIPIGSLHSPDELMEHGPTAAAPILIPTVYPPPHLSSFSAITALSFGKIYLYDTWTHTFTMVTPEPDLNAPCGNDFSMFTKVNNRHSQKLNGCGIPVPRVSNSFVLWENDGHLPTVPMHNSGLPVLSTRGSKSTNTNATDSTERYYHHILYGGSYTCTLPNELQQIAPRTGILEDIMVLITTVRTTTNTDTVSPSFLSGKKSSSTELSFSWLRPTITPNSTNYQPRPRCEHAACILPLPDCDGGPIMFVHGGRGNGGIFNDSPILALDDDIDKYRVSFINNPSIDQSFQPTERMYTEHLQFQWYNPVVFGTAPLPRHQHTVTSIASTLAPLPSGTLGSPSSATTDTVTTVHDSLYKDITCRSAIVFGGKLFVDEAAEVNDVPYNDLYIVTVTRAPTTKQYIVTWSQPITLAINRSLSTGPIGRHSHTAVYAPVWSTPSFINCTNPKNDKKESVIVSPVDNSVSTNVFPVDHDAAFRCEVAGISSGYSELSASAPLAITLPGSLLIFGGQDHGIHRTLLDEEYSYFREVRHQALRNWMAFVENERQTSSLSNDERNKSLPEPFPRYYDRNGMNNDDDSEPFLFHYSRLTKDKIWRLFCRKDINRFEMTTDSSNVDEYVDENIHVLKLTIAPDIRTITPVSTVTSSVALSSSSMTTETLKNRLDTVGGRYAGLRVSNERTGFSSSDRNTNVTTLPVERTLSILDCFSPVQRYVVYSLLHPFVSLLESLPCDNGSSSSSSSNNNPIDISSSSSSTLSLAATSSVASLFHHFVGSRSSTNDASLLHLFVGSSSSINDTYDDTNAKSLRFNNQDTVTLPLLSELVSVLQSMTSNTVDTVSLPLSSPSVIRHHIAQLLSIVWSRSDYSTLACAQLKYIRGEDNIVPSNGSQNTSGSIDRVKPLPPSSGITYRNLKEIYSKNKIEYRSIESQRIATILGYSSWLHNLIKMEPLNHTHSPSNLSSTNEGGAHDIDRWLISTLPSSFVNLLQRRITGEIPRRTMSTLFAIEFNSFGSPLLRRMNGIADDGDEARLDAYDNRVTGRYPLNNHGSNIRNVSGNQVNGGNGSTDNSSDQSKFLISAPYEKESLHALHDNLQDIKEMYNQSIPNPSLNPLPSVIPGANPNNGSTRTTISTERTVNAEQQRKELLPFALPLHAVAEWSQPECYMNAFPPIPVPPVPVPTMVSDFTKLADQSINLTLKKTTHSTSDSSPPVPPNTDIVLNLQKDDSLSPATSLSSLSGSFSSSPPPPNTLSTYRWLLRNRSPFFEVLFGKDNAYLEATTGTLHFPPNESLITTPTDDPISNSTSSTRSNDEDTTAVLHNCHRETMIRLLHYLITDTLHPILNPPVCMNLFLMAYRLSLPRLALLVEGYLVKWIDEDNVCGFYQFMDEVTNLFNEPVELTDTRIPTGKVDEELQPVPDGDNMVRRRTMHVISRSSIGLRFQPSNVSLNTTAGMGRSLRSACISYLLREYKRMMSISSTSPDSSNLYTDFVALPEHLQSEIKSLWETQNHAYSYNRTVKN